MHPRDARPGCAATASTAPAASRWPGRRGRAGAPRGAATPAAWPARPPAVLGPGCDRSPHRRGWPPPTDPSRRHRHRPPGARSAGVGGRVLPAIEHLATCTTSGPPGRTRWPTVSARSRPPIGGPACGSTHGVRIRPILGSTTWWRSASTRMAPVVNRTERAELPRLEPREPNRAPAALTRDATHPSSAAPGPTHPTRCCRPPCDWPATTAPHRPLSGSRSCAAPAATTPAPGSTPLRMRP